MWELEEEKVVDQEGIHQPGGGGKSAFETITFLEEEFFGVLERHTAGSRMDETLRWTHLKPNEIARLLGHEGIEVSVTVLDQLLKKHNFPKPKAVKTLATGESEHL
ncbi:ISAzo13-like element transposase-related protein [Trichormus azollae]|uniref:ISAzo13-like element transposase-related protein n=1 Tax=Trichormus azollae TaxID=1164 RepID=UPI00325E2E5B